MKFISSNPFNGEQLQSFTEETEAQIKQRLAKGKEAFLGWRKLPMTDRAKLLKKAAQILEDGVEEYAKMITLEMGKPISESRGEVKKCAWVCRYYADYAKIFLQDELVSTDAHFSFVKHEPIGGVLAIMPWNFPFWQVFRFAAPTLMAGNVAVLKHAPNVFGCAQLMEDIFTKAGFPEGVFQNFIVHHDKTESIIANDLIQAVSLTGSGAAGAAVAAISGKYIKKSLLELGGNNAFIVWADANIDQAVATAVTARMLNAGQSCIAAKRFILVEEIYEEFVSKYTEAIANLKSGDPMDEETQVGPLARKDLADQLQKQVQESISQGAKLLYGGKQNDCYHEPTILGEVTSDMTAFKEETFGPLAAMIKAKDEMHAFRLAEESKFGLGVTVCTQDLDKAVSMSSEVSDGAFFVNELVKSDPRLPFGGTKNSGYGRELAKDGILEFVNRKTIYVK